MKNVIKKMALCVSIVALLASCNSPKPVKTIENLKAGITGETGANAKYLAFAQKATDEGYPNISTMFKAAAAAEAIHIKNHNAVLTKIGEKEFVATPDAIQPDSTMSNLQSAIDGETYEFTTMYPEFLKVANEEKSKDAITSFTWAQDAEKKHAQMYAYALNILKTTSNDSTVSGTWYVCPKCGNLYNSIDGVENCELCATKSGMFVKF